MLSVGRTLGLRAPDCAKESSTLWTLLTLRRGCLGACSRLCPRARLASRSCRGASPSVRARLCVPVAALCLGARLALRSCRSFALARLASRSCRGAFPRFTPAVCLATNRTACDMLRSYSAGSRSPFVRSRSVSAVICLRGFTSGLYVSLWRSRRGTRDGVTRGTGHGAGGAALVRFCASALALRRFPRGVRWGCAPQTCAKESSTLWTLFTLRRGCLGACSRVCPCARLALRSCRGVGA